MTLLPERVTGPTINGIDDRDRHRRIVHSWPDINSVFARAWALAQERGGLNGGGGVGLGPWDCGRQHRLSTGCQSVRGVDTS